jgi:arylsulfatase A-like enzyme
MAALMTGHYPDATGVTSHSAADVLAGPMPTLAEIMGQAGYQTHAFVNNGWLAKPGQRFDRGFDVFMSHRRDSLGTFDGRVATRRAIETIEACDEDPCFLWVHYIEPHMPYAAPTEISGLFGNPSGKSKIIDDWVSKRISPQEIHFSTRHDPAEVEATRNLYDAAVRRVDGMIGELLRAIDRTGKTDDYLVVFTADHGEGLGEHGLFFGHGFDLYEESVHVPLMVRIPGHPPAEITAEVSLVDILPSVCRWLSLPCSPTDGEPLALTPAQERPGRVVYSTSMPFVERYRLNPRLFVEGLEGRWSMAQSQQRKLVRIPHPDGPIWESFDLDEDPQERNPREVPIEPLQEDLQGWLESNRARRFCPGGDPTTMDAETLEALQSLGYMR